MMVSTCSNSMLSIFSQGWHLEANRWSRYVPDPGIPLAGEGIPVMQQEATPYQCVIGIYALWR